MALGRHRFALGLAVLASLALVDPASADSPVFRTGSTRYVRVVHLTHGRLTFALTASGRKRFKRALRGSVLDAECTTLGPAVQGSTLSSVGAGSERTVGPGGRVTDLVLLDPHADFCDIGRARRKVTRSRVTTTEVAGPPLERLALTQRGAAYMDEDRVTLKLFVTLNSALEYAHADKAGHFPPAERVTTKSGGKVIALGSPDASPPAGVVGLFSDGVNHAEAVGLSALHQRLFIDSNGGTLSTNAQEHMFRVAAGEATTLFGT